MLEKEEPRGIDLEKLKDEQLSLSRKIVLKDAFDFENAKFFAAIHTETFDTSILATASVLDENLEVIENKYAVEKARFPYVPGFRAYRELKAMIKAYQNLETDPDVIFVEGHGISHPRQFGLACHLGLSLSKPTIGVAKNLLVGEVKNSDVIFKGKVVAKSLLTKEGAKPIYVSPGHLISLDSAVKIVKKCLKKPHKMPEPIVKARKFAKKIRKELKRELNNGT